MKQYKKYPMYIMVLEKGISYWYRQSNKKGKKKMSTSMGNFFVNPIPENIEPIQNVINRNKFYNTFITKTDKLLKEFHYKNSK